MVSADTTKVAVLKVQARFTGFVVK